MQGQVYQLLLHSLLINNSCFHCYPAVTLPSHFLLDRLSLGMEGNQSWIAEFILVGFQLSEDMELVLFGIFSLLYTFNLLANGMILGLICLDLNCTPPCYFCLIWPSLTYPMLLTVPNLLANLVKHKKDISFILCTFTQMILI